MITSILYSVSFNNITSSIPPAMLFRTRWTKFTCLASTARREEPKDVGDDTDILIGRSARISGRLVVFFFSNSKRPLSTAVFNPTISASSSLMSFSCRITFSSRAFFSTVVENSSASTSRRRVLMSFNANDSASRSYLTSVSYFRFSLPLFSAFSLCGASSPAKGDGAPVPELSRGVSLPAEPASSRLDCSRLRPAFLVTLSTTGSLSCTISDFVNWRLLR